MENSYENDFKIKYDGQQHQIDAITLLNSLMQMTPVIQEINKELNPQHKIDIKINALEKGSFLIHLELDFSLLEKISQIFTKDNVDLAKEVVATLAGVIGLVKLVKTKKKEGDKIDTVPVKEISQGDGSVKLEISGGTVTISQTVYRVYQNPIVTSALEKQFDALASDDSIEAFEITDSKGKALVEVKKEDFAELAEPVTLPANGSNQNFDLTKARLNINKLSFEDKTGWSFYYKGIKISAKVNDSDFLAKVKNGERFANGDVLIVELQTLKIFDEAANTWINKSYTVVKVHEHIPRGTQGQLGF
ncbi:hypothetical protein [Hymenobacter sp. UYAg731]